MIIVALSNLRYINRYPFYAMEILSCSSIRKLFFTKPEIKESIKEEDKSVSETKAEGILEDTNINKEDSRNVKLVEDTMLNTDTSKGSEIEYELLDKLFALLDTKKEINPILSSYFHKIVENLLAEYKEELLKYLFDNKKHWNNLLYHCYNISIADTVFDLLSITPNDSSENLFHSHKRKIIADLIENIKATNNEEIIINLREIIFKLIASKRYLDSLLKNEVINFMTSNDNLNVKYLLMIIKVKLELGKENKSNLAFDFSFLINKVLSIMELLINILNNKDKVEYLLLLIDNEYAIWREDNLFRERKVRSNRIVGSFSPVT